MVLGSKIPINDILAAIQPTLSKLQKIHIGNYAEPSEACIPKEVGENEIHVVVNDLSEDKIETLLTTLGKTQKLICLTSLTHAKCGTRSTLCWKVGNISGSIELFAL